MISATTPENNNNFFKREKKLLQKTRGLLFVPSSPLLLFP
jgi:hypothetical protein